LWACWNLISLYWKQPLLCQVEMSFSAFWHCHFSGDVLAAWRAFRATWLSEQILTYFSGLAFVWISRAQAKIAYILAWKLWQTFLERSWAFIPKTPALVPASWTHLFTRQAH
jgi:hypothetical protein